MSTEPGARRTPAGYWLDESVPDLSRLLKPAGIPPGEFSAWLGPLVGAYRSGRKEKDLLPDRSANHDAARRLEQHLADMLAQLAPGTLPPEAAAELSWELHRVGADRHALEERLRADLALMHVTVHRVATSLAKQPAQPRGRKPTTGRDRLLAQVVDRIRTAAPRMRAGDARALASRVLEACRVATPESSDDETLRKAAARGRRAGKK